MSNKRSSGDGYLGIALIILGILGLLFGWLFRLLYRLLNLVKPYTPRSLYDPQQVQSTRGYWIVWMVGFLVTVPFILPLFYPLFLICSQSHLRSELFLLYPSLPSLLAAGFTSFGTHKHPFPPTSLMRRCAITVGN